jgi:anti-sigma-K factor RskA
MLDDTARDSVVAYVLGALDPEQVAAVQAHLEVCADCKALERRMRWTASLLPFAAEAARAPDGLVDRILAAASNEPHRPAALPSRPSVRRRPGTPWRAVAAALAAAVVAIGAWSVYLGVQVHQLSSTQPRTFSLHARPALAGARGEVLWLPGQRTVLVEFQQLPPIPSDQVYELWLGTTGGRLQAAGVFRPEAGGSQLLVLNRDLSDYRLIALTVEPGPDGTEAPTEAPRMTGTLG